MSCPGAPPNPDEVDGGMARVMASLTVYPDPPVAGVADEIEKN
jgi:hypothetical protein